MEILVIRHGHAVDSAPEVGDTGRWLTGKGRKATRKVARWLTEDAPHRPVEIWTSPLVRAVQTAEIVAEYLELLDEVRVVPDLSPGHDPRDLLKRLGERAQGGPIALVGHEPDLSMLATALLGEVAWPGFKKSGVLGVSWKNGQASFRYLLNPKGMELTTDVRALRKS